MGPSSFMQIDGGLTLGLVQVVEAARAQHLGLERAGQRSRSA